jgi:YVTN family beta-propeller protein
VLLRAGLVVAGKGSLDRSSYLETRAVYDSIKLPANRVFERGCSDRLLPRDFQSRDKTALNYRCICLEFRLSNDPGRAIYVRSIALFAAVTGVALCCGTPVTAQNGLTLEARIPLGAVRGRIDHMAVDLTRQRLFVAELENDTVGVIDLKARNVTHVITEVRQPQGLAYFPFTDTLFAASGADGSVRAFRADQYHPVGHISLGEDADNIRVDAKTKRIFVSYGNGGFAIIDVLTQRKVGEIALNAHPQGFQLDEQSRRIYANLPKEQAVIVLDDAAGAVISKWQVGNASNFPLTLNKPRITCLSCCVIRQAWSPLHQTAPALRIRRLAMTPTTCFPTPSAIASMSVAERDSWMCSMQAAIAALLALPRSEARERLCSYPSWTVFSSP